MYQTINKGPQKITISVFQVLSRREEVKLHESAFIHVVGVCYATKRALSEFYKCH